MANTYTYTFLAKDLMSSKLNKISQKGQSTFTDINKKHERFNRNIDTSTSKLAGMSKGVGSVVGLLGRLGVAFTITGLGSSIIKLGADMEQTKISFETMLGSADKAQSVLNGLNQFANKTPFKNKEVIAAGRNLLAFGVSNEKLLPTLKAVGDVSAGLKIPFTELSEIYGKIKVQNTVYSEDLNQLAGRGIPIFTELSKVMGVVPEHIKKLASQGKITFPYIEQAFANMTGKGGQFFNLMDKQSQSFGGKWSTFVGKLQDGATKFGLKVLPILSRFTDWGIAAVDFLPKIPAYFTAIRQTIQDNIVPIGLLTGAFVALNAGLIASKVSFLLFTVQFKAYVLWTKIATAAQWLWNAALTANPIGLIVAGILALAAGIVYAYQKVGWFRGGILAIWESMKGFGNAIKEFVIDRIKQMISGITGIGAALMAFFKGDWKKAWELGKQATQNLTGIGVGNGSKFMANMQQTGKNAAEAYNKGVAEAAANKKKPSIFDKITGASKSGTAGTSGAVTPTADLADPLKSGISAITGGGSKQTNINVNFDKLVENYTVQTQTFEQGMDESLETFKRMLLRVMNSANQMQTSPV